MDKDTDESLTKDSNLISSHPTERSKESFSQCKICGASAEHSNYGAASCSPCKMFFRRNAITGQGKFKCDRDGHCEININNRHVCSSCRLAKCFANGMQPELIRCSLSKKSSSKEKQTTENESYTPTSNILKRFEDESQLREFPIMNLLQSDTSASLYSTQWTLISNLIYCYDESGLLSLGRQIANENQDTQVSTSLSSQFFTEVYKTAEKYLRSNQNLYRLSTDDRASFIHIAAESITWTGAIFTWKQCQLSNCSSFITDFKNTYGDNLLNSIERVLKYMEIDLVIFKLGLSLFTFCNNLLLFPSMTVVKPESIRAVFHIQSTSAEVTWKYLLYKYGAQQSVRRFMNLIQSFLLTMETIHDAQNSPEHVNDIETIVEKVELALILDDIEHIDDNKNDL